jgi:Carboxypeptidase regulatory-like domain
MSLVCSTFQPKFRHARLLRRSAFMLSFVLLLAGYLCAQSGLGRVTGRASDASGAVIPGASVRITNVGTQVSQDSVTSSDGIYNFNSLNPGNYRLEVKMSGFQTSVVESFAVSADQPATVNVALQVGQSAQNIVVSAHAELLNTSSPEVATTIEHDVVANLPYAERSSLPAVMLVAGVRGNPFSAGQVSTENPGVYTGYIVPGAEISVGGAPPGRSAILVDGSDVTQTSFPRAGINVSGDMVQETTVITSSIPAQFGQTQGGVIIQSTKSGSNEFHVGGTYRHSDPSLQAFPLGGVLPAAQHQNFFGAYAEGPVVLPKLYNGRNRTFFDVGVEPARLTNAISGQGQVPTPAELAGNFSNSISFLNTTILSTQGYAAALAAPRTGGLYNQFPTNAAGFPSGAQYANPAQYVPITSNNLAAQLAQNPLAQFIVSRMPTPQNPGPYFTFINSNGYWGNNGNNVNYIRGVQNTDNRYAFRIDHLISTSDRIFVRYTDEPITSARFFAFPPSSPLNSTPSDQAWSSDIAINETHMFGPTIVNELRLLYMRDKQIRSETGTALSQDWAASLGLTPAVLGKGFPSINFGYSFNNLGTSSATSQVDENYGVADDISWTKGIHSLKFGVDIRRLESNQYNLGGLYGGSYNFSANSTNNGTSGGNGLASLMLGLINTYSNTPVQVPAYYRWHYYAGYLQDDIKVLPKLTLNVGMRYEVETPRIEKYGNQGTFVPGMTGTVNGQPVTGAFCFSGGCGLGNTLWPTNYMGFEPRAGLAWAPGTRMTVRAGYSLLRVPLSGYGNTPNPDFNVPSFAVGGVNGGATAGQAVNFLTNPVGPLTSALAALQGKGPFFTALGITVPYVQQTSSVPYSQQWSLSLQFQVTSSTLLQVSYQGLKGTHLITNFAPALNIPNLPDLNSRVSQGYNFSAQVANPLGIRQNGSVIQESALQSLNPYQNFYNQTLGQYYNRQGDSTYNGLYVSGTQRLRSGLSMVASFAWSKSIDDTGGDNNIQNGGPFAGAPVQYYNDLRQERAVSSWDIPLKTTVGYTYQLPLGTGKLLSTHNRIIDGIIGGWVTSGMFTAESGQPFAPVLGSSGYWVSTNGSSALPAGINLRPNIASGVACINPAWRANPFGQPYINPAMFSVPGSLGSPAFGNAPRTVTDCRSPRVVTFDANLYRRFRLGGNEKHYLEVGVNALNAFNHPVFFLPGNSNYSAYNAFNTASLTNAAVPGFTNQTSFGFLSPGNTEGISRVVQLSARLFW